MLGSLIGGALSFLGGERRNTASKSAAREQMRFQERMSNTAFQRSTADMRAAGINPILAYQRGGASTPSGAQPNITNSLDHAPTSAANYMLAKRQRAEIENLKATTALGVANAGLAKEKTNTEQLTQAGISANIGLTNQSTATELARTQKEWDLITGILADNKKKMAEADIASTEALKARIDEKIYRSGAYEARRWLEKMGVNPSDAAGLLRLKRGKLPSSNPSKKVNLGGKKKSVAERYQDKYPVFE
ncbi:DNA pilot protein [Microviridae sp.]|nr:DNA pilot protein [Microviridae sp.]